MLLGRTCHLGFCLPGLIRKNTLPGSLEPYIVSQNQSVTTIFRWRLPRNSQFRGRNWFYRHVLRRSTWRLTIRCYLSSETERIPYNFLTEYMYHVSHEQLSYAKLFFNLYSYVCSSNIINELKIIKEKLSTKCVSYGKIKN